MKLNSVFCLLFSFIMLIACSQSPVSDGSSTETGNVKAIIEGSVLYGDTAYFSGAFVYIRKNHFLKDVDLFDVQDIADDTTSNKGYFFFHPTDTGVYRVNIIKGEIGIMVTCTLATDSTQITLSSMYASNLGSCIGEVVLEGGDDDVSYDEIYIRWYGTNVLTKVNKIDGTFSTTGLSAGIYSVQIYPANYPDMAVVVDNVKIVSGEEAVIDPVILTFSDG